MPGCAARLGAVRCEEPPPPPVTHAPRKVEALLAGGGPFLLGARLTECDVRLLPTLLRFDAAYGPLFKAGGAGGLVLRADLPRLNAWMK